MPPVEHPDTIAMPDEEARLLAILTDCGYAITAARQALMYPTHSMLMPEYRRLEKKLDKARIECVIALANWRGCRKAKRNGNAGGRQKGVK